MLGFVPQPNLRTAGVWTKDITKAHTVANSVRAGTVWINCYHVFDAAAPFGGFK
ncbi:MAG: aldehyde dehydrogenase family protein, partial [Rivularia sp. (in: cyanobacteria)]